MLVKICGVKDPKIAAFAAENGADFIGFIMSPGFARSVTEEQAKQIIQAAVEAGACPVAVFVKTPIQEIELICARLNLQTIQIYSVKQAIPEDLHCFYSRCPQVSLRPGKDYLLIESDQPGSGKSIDYSTLSIPQQRPWFLAGGLTPNNVKRISEQYQPDGVDVSSGVEREGRKHPELILKFIKEAKSV
jgi:phosphoribosylanthranilate isomerase